MLLSLSFLPSFPSCPLVFCAPGQGQWQRHAPRGLLDLFAAARAALDRWGQKSRRPRQTHHQRLVVLQGYGRAPPSAPMAVVPRLRAAFHLSLAAEFKHPHRAGRAGDGHCPHARSPLRTPAFGAARRGGQRSWFDRPGRAVLRLQAPRLRLPVPGRAVSVSGETVFVRRKE